MHKVIAIFNEVNGIERETFRELKEELGLIGSLSDDVGDVELYYTDNGPCYAIAHGSESYYGIHPEDEHVTTLEEAYTRIIVGSLVEVIISEGKTYRGNVLEIKDFSYIIEPIGCLTTEPVEVLKPYVKRLFLMPDMDNENNVNQNNTLTFNIKSTEPFKYTHLGRLVTVNDDAYNAFGKLVVDEDPKCAHIEEILKNKFNDFILNKFYLDTEIVDSINQLFNTSIKTMKCIDNRDYEDCMTIGKDYEVEIEELGNGEKMYKFKDDNGEPLQTMIYRFE